MDVWNDWLTSQLPTVLLGVALLSVAGALIGCFAYLRHRSLAGDVVAHALLPGLCLGYLAAGSRQLLALMAGAFATGWLALWLHDLLTRRFRIREDTSIAALLSIFFGAGALLLTHIQHDGRGTQAGLDQFLFGKAASLVASDVWLMAALAAVVAGSVALGWRVFWIVSFDPEYARVLGLPVARVEAALTLLTVAAVVAGVQVVGVVLMAALLATPAVAARSWTDRVPTMLLLAAGISLLSGVAGTLVSASGANRPTGPWFVVMLSTAALLSLLLAPKRGLLARMIRRRRNRLRIQEENVLKGFWHLNEADGAADGCRTAEQLSERGLVRRRFLVPTLRRLTRKGWLRASSHGWTATPQGLEQGRRITRRHRLWEAWLAENLRLPDDHLHDDAEAMEHVIGPEVEDQLARDLNKPSADPHGREIP